MLHIYKFFESTSIIRMLSWAAHLFGKDKDPSLRALNLTIF